MNAIDRLLSGKEGEVLTVNPDWIVINDGPSAAAVGLVQKVADKDRVVVFHDHDVPTGTPESAALFKKLNIFRQRHGLRFVAEKGVAYQYMLENMVAEGQVVLGAGSHGSIFAAAGAIGIDVSPSELARAMESGEYSIIVPKKATVSLTGSLKGNAGAMDVGFYLRKLLAGHQDTLVVIDSPLDAADNAVVASIVSECVYSVVFRSVDKADHVVDLSAIGMMVMLPVDSRESQANAQIIPFEGLETRSFKAGLVGGYTAGTVDCLRSFRDLVKGRTLRLGFRLTVVPATASDYLAALDEGIVEDLMDYGAQIVPPSDRSIVVQGAGAMGDRETLITTGLYTFRGAMGMDTSLVYSASPYLVAVASYQEEV